jgi:hypothetical protein
LLAKTDTGAKIEKVCRSWTDGFTLISASEKRQDITESVKAPLPEEYVTRYPRPPPAMAVPKLSGLKRSICTSDDLAITPEKQDRIKRASTVQFVGASGVLHSFKKNSTVNIRFQGPTPSLNVIFVDLGGASDIQWIDQNTATLLFHRNSPRRSLPHSAMHLRLVYTLDGSETEFHQKVIIDTCNNCADCATERK